MTTVQCHGCETQIPIGVDECPTAPRICRPCRKNPLLDKKWRSKLDVAHEALEAHLTQHRRAGHFEETMKEWLDNLVIFDEDQEP